MSKRVQRKHRALIQKFFHPFFRHATGVTHKSCKYSDNFMSARGTHLSENCLSLWQCVLTYELKLIRPVGRHLLRHSQSPVHRDPYCSIGEASWIYIIISILFISYFGVLCNVDAHVWACLCVYTDGNVGVLRVLAYGGQRRTTGTAPQVRSTLLFETRPSLICVNWLTGEHQTPACFPLPGSRIISMCGHV